MPMSTMHHFSVSQLGMYSRCPYQWFRRYGMGEKRPPGIAAHVGTGVHGGAKVALESKRDTGHDLEPGSTTDAAVAAYDARLAMDDVLLTPLERTIGRAKVAGAARDRTAAFAHFWACATQPEYQPVSVERRFSLPLKGDGLRLVGVIDCEDQAGWVTDWKTGARRRPQKEVDCSDQLTAYAMAYHARHGTRPVGVRLDCLVEGEQTRRVVLDSERTRKHYAAFVERVKAALKAIRAGSFPACDPTSWWCDPKWCGYWEVCRYSVK